MFKLSHMNITNTLLLILGEPGVIW